MSYTDFERQYKSENPDATEKEIKYFYGREQGTLGAAWEGIKSGGYQLLGGIGTLGEMAGLPSADFAAQMNREAQALMPEEFRGKLLADEPSLLTDPRWLAFSTGQVLPSIASSLAGGGVAGGLGRAVGAKSIPLWQSAGAGLVGGAQEAAGMRQEGGTIPESLLYGAGTVGLNMIPAHQMFSKILAGKGNMLSNIVKQGLAEGITEWAEEPWGAIVRGQDVGEAMRQGLNVIPPSFLASALTGGLAGGVQKFTNAPQTLQRAPIPETVNIPQQNALAAEIRPSIYNARVFQGSPHKFAPEQLIELSDGTKRFHLPENPLPKGAKVIEDLPLGRARMDKIGTGEGGQAYGYGLYFAESPGVAETYATKNPPEKFRGIELAARYDYLQRKMDRLPVSSNEFKDLQEQYAVLEDIGLGSTKKDLLRRFDTDEYSRKTRDFVKRIQDNEVSQHSMYEVDIPDKYVDNFLDWDKPLSEQLDKLPEEGKQILDEITAKREKVRAGFEAKIRATGKEPKPWLTSIEETTTGSDFYKELAKKLGGDEKASEYLNSLGIKGIKYLDQASRGAVEGTRNLVVFDENIVKVLSRNGEKIPDKVEKTPEVKPQVMKQEAFQDLGTKIQDINNRIAALEAVREACA